MKVIIDVTDEQYEKVKRLCAFGLNGEAEDEILYGVDFTKNATNGDIIKEMFPNFEIVDLDPIILEQNYPKPFCKMQFNRKWWNAPYIEGDNK